MGDKKHKSGQNQLISQQTAGSNAILIANSIPPTPIIAAANILPTQFARPIQHGNANEEQNIRYVAVPVDQLFLALTSLEQKEAYILVRLEEHSEEERDVVEGAEDLPETKVRMMLIV